MGASLDFLEIFGAAMQHTNLLSRPNPAYT